MTSSSPPSGWSKVCTGLVPRVALSVSITLLFVLLGSGYGPAWAAPLYKNSLIRNGVLIIAAIFSRMFIGEGLARRQGVKQKDTKEQVEKSQDTKKKQ
jgi:hypothetical protein